MSNLRAGPSPRLIAALMFSASLGSLFAQETSDTTEDSSPPAETKKEPILVLEKFVTGGVGFNVMPQAPATSAVGFARKVEETPRSMSILSSEMVDKVGIRDGDQLFQVIPGTYTVNRWGIAGSTQVRNTPADTYLRGMKRIDAQGNIRNVITMWDQVEVVRGPPSPIFGNGRIGGYTNYVPKSVRGTTGKYLEQATGSVSVVVGSFNRTEMQVNYAAPLAIKGHEAGYQVFALTNDSDSYYKDNFQKDRVFQGSFSMNLNDDWHIESGVIYQRATNAGQAGANRVDQYSLDNSLYLRGSALVNLDLDGNGTVSEKEIQDSRNFPDGTRSTVNRPLSIVFPFVPGGRPAVAGVPKYLKQLLALPQYASVAASPQGQAILAAPDGGPLAYTGTSGTTATQQVPIGFFLNPAQVTYTERDWSLVAIEEEADGHTLTGYLDFIADDNADETKKLQFFYDYQKQDKRSQLPFNQVQQITAAEVKYTHQRKAETIPVLNRLPEWAELDLLGSVNVRYTDAGGISTTGDYDQRRDLVTGYRPTDTFTSFIISGDRSFATGEPISTATYSEYVESGAGVLADMLFFKRLGFLPAIRYDYVQAESVDHERYNRTGSAALSGTGAFLPRVDREGNDHALSRSFSLNYRTGLLGMIPYVTSSNSSAILSGTRQEIATSNVGTGNILGAAKLIEGGIKGNALGGKLYYSAAFYEQFRSSSVLEEGESFVRSTVNRGWEYELRYAPNRNLSFALNATFSRVERTQLAPGTFRTALATAEYIGFQDLKDSAGNVILPASAFLLGGNAQVAIPASATDYNRFGQYPEAVMGAFVGYTSPSGWSASWQTTFVSDVAASSELYDLLQLPEYLISTASIGYNSKRWRLSLIVRNVFDELYWVPNNGSFGGMLLQTGLPRNAELSITRNF